MINKSNKMKFLTLMVVAVVYVLANGSLTGVFAQAKGDPFSKPVWQRPKDPKAPATTATGTTTGPGTAKVVVKKEPPAIVPVGAPAIQDRLNYYITIRERAALSGDVLPKVTTVMTLDEMSVTGIFKTPKGYAAMVQANPIGMSYTIYPGEKFFNGQLVAVEENRLVFRKVIKMSNGKFITSEENKVLRQYTQQEEIQGTAPADTSAKTETKPADTSVAGQPADPSKPAQPTAVVSPLEEMNKQPVEAPKAAKVKAIDKTKKGKASTAAKKPLKVAAVKK